MTTFHLHCPLFFSGNGVPYATQEVHLDCPAYEKEFHLQETHKNLPDKVRMAVCRAS